MAHGHTATSLGHLLSIQALAWTQQGRFPDFGARLALPLRDSRGHLLVGSTLRVHILRLVFFLCELVLNMMLLMVFVTRQMRRDRRTID